MVNDFHDLHVVDVRKTIKDAVVVTLQPTQEANFDFVQGQYLTFRRDFDGTELRRSYSICSAVNEDDLKVGIKKVEGGAFSTWANEHLVAGDTLQAMQPMGNFHTPIEVEKAKRYLGFAGGSGITPLLSIMKTVLALEPYSRFTLVYANRGIHSIMFREELEDLKNRYMTRLSIIHVLESDSQDIDLFKGRVDTEKCNALFRGWINIKATDTAFICGPEPMMLGIVAALKEHGMEDEQIKFELFVGTQTGRIETAESAADHASNLNATELQVSMDGALRTITMEKNTTVLEAMLANSVDAPFACRAGVCSTCRCRIIKGEVRMANNHALDESEVDAGYTLACQAYPISDLVVVDYD